MREHKESEGREEIKEGRQGRGCRRLTCQISCECVLQILTFWGLLYRPPVIDEGQILCAKQTKRLHLHAKFHLNVFIVSVSGAKTTILGKL